MAACLFAACGAVPQPACPDGYVTAAHGGAKIGEGKKSDATAQHESGGAGAVRNGEGTKKHDVAACPRNGGDGSGLTNGSAGKKQDLANVTTGGSGSGSTGVKKHDLKMNPKTT